MENVTFLAIECEWKFGVTVGLVRNDFISCIPVIYAFQKLTNLAENLGVFCFSLFASDECLFKIKIFAYVYVYVYVLDYVLK
jgi:hypothetical protein